MRSYPMLCKVCGETKDRTAFYFYKKQRVVVGKKCYACFKRWLLSDSSGKKISRALANDYIDSLTANLLRAELESIRRDVAEQRKAKLRDIATKQHEHRRFLEAKYGIRAATPTERLSPEALAAFEADQKPRRARYEADTAREQARRDKISAALKGKPRAPRAPSAADRLAAAARERS